MDAQTYIKYFTNSSALWRQMEDTVENSPYHREDNVAVHTQMCIDQYLKRFAPIRTELQNNIALMALLFHDTGKPDAEEMVEKKDGTGTYRRYSGHELLSAVSFTECWLQDEHLREVLTLDDARKVRFIIEHHLPYNLKDDKKRSDLRTAIEHTLGADAQTFYDCLRSDAAGRISDDHEAKLQNVEVWIDKFRMTPLTINRYRADIGKCFVLIGPSGSGKTTWMRAHKRDTDFTISLDTYRLQLYGGSDQEDPKIKYAQAWKYCNEREEEFKRFVDASVRETFAKAQKTGGSVFIDNVNSSKRARSKCIQTARRLGMKVVAVEFWNTFDTVLGRQKTRTDKEVSHASVRQQYNAQTSAWKGTEVDEVIVVPEEVLFI
jgi:predicted kinase